MKNTLFLKPLTNNSKYKTLFKCITIRIGEARDGRERTKWKMPLGPLKTLEK
jgi:hypothetical protein